MVGLDLGSTVEESRKRETCLQQQEQHVQPHQLQLRFPQGSSAPHGHLKSV